MHINLIMRYSDRFGNALPLTLTLLNISCLSSPPLCVQEAEVGNSSVPEPFDVRTEHAVEARALNFDEATEVGAELGVSNGD